MNEEAYRSINKKMGKTISMPIEKLIPSEFNTRHAFVDKDHVNYLAARIKERGFHPKRAISLNVIKDVKGREISYRVVAGIHRFAAAKKGKLTEIPCLLYYGLTEDEECLLDKWDNEMDEDHKEIHFLEEAEHYKYLKQEKNWSVRQIARNKGISKSVAADRLKISCMPEETKKIILSVRHGGHFSERHFREICKLQTKESMLQICQEIVTRGLQAEKNEADENGTPILPMKQKEITERVEELLEMEARGEKIELATKVDVPVATLNKKPTAEIYERPELEHHMSGFNPGIRTEKWSTDNMKFDIILRWMKYSPLSNLGFALWGTLRTLIEFCLRYHSMSSDNSQDQFFFIADAFGNNNPRSAYAILAAAIGLKSVEKMEKKHLKELENRGFITILKATAPGYPKFRINWDKLKEFYDRYAWDIHFNNGGLADIPETFTGVISPTPCHDIYIQNGRINKGIDYGMRDTYLQLTKEIGFPQKMAWKIINTNSLMTIRKTLKDLPYHEQRYKDKGKEIKNRKGFFLAALKDDWALFA